MTTKIIKDLNSVCNISFKGLGHPGPFSYTVERGNLPPGTAFDPADGFLRGTFTTVGVYIFTIKGFYKERIKGSEDFEITVS